MTFYQKGACVHQRSKVSAVLLYLQFSEWAVWSLTQLRSLASNSQRLIITDNPSPNPNPFEYWNGLKIDFFRINKPDSFVSYVKSSKIQQKLLGWGGLKRDIQVYTQPCKPIIALSHNSMTSSPARFIRTPDNQASSQR